MKGFFLSNICFFAICTLCACISNEDLYGNWCMIDSPVIAIIDKSYRFYASPLYPPYFGRSGKHRYTVKNYGILLRIEHGGHCWNAFNLLGFKMIDQTNYWLGFIPILGFRFSYKISDEKVLEYLKKYEVDYDKTLNQPIYVFPNGKYPDHSVPAIIEKLKK